MKSSIFWDITLHSPLKINVSEEHVTSIFVVEETRMKQVASSIISQKAQLSSMKYSFKNERP
jgi:hypothetical protein